jgi:hypothetical protein
MAQESDETPRLDPSQLYEKRRTADIYRLKTYNKILDQIYHRILTISKIPNAPSRLLFEVKPFIFGLARYDMEDLVVYLIYQLRHAKYLVGFTPPNLLMISWENHERMYLTEQSPIMQTMLESFEKSEAEKEASRLLYSKKSQKKVRMQVPGEMQQPRSAMKSQGIPMSAIRNVLHQGGPPNGLNPVAAPPVESAAAYVPPSSFLQNILNPPSSAAKPQSSIDYLR